MLPVTTVKDRVAEIKPAAVALAKRFAKDEEGGIIVFTIMVLITMLVVGGMAVDFMRFESERAMLQSCADRSVLAAAELDQTVPPDQVVVDFFEKCGYPGAIVGTPTVNADSNSREVSVVAELDVDTFYLRFIGIDTLSAPASAQAVEGIGNVEVSLVLDITGSMGGWVSSEGTTRIELLKDAAQDFVDDLLLPDYEDQISINLVAYSQQVGIGDDIYKQLRTTEDTFFLDGSTGSSFVTRDMAESNPSLDTGVDNDNLDTDPTNPHFTNPARCIRFEDDEFNTLTFDTQRVYEQVEYYDHYSGSNTNSFRMPLCPQEWYEQIIPLSQDADRLKDAIERYQPTQFTSIHMGLKWGVSLLDPSMRDLLGNISSIDPAFRDERPADYAANGGGVNTVKYLILMTDGQNVQGRRVPEEFYRGAAASRPEDEQDDFTELSDFVNNPQTQYEWMTVWAEYPMQNWRRYRDGRPTPRNDVWEPGSTAAQNDIWTQQLCDLAAQHMTVFTIAMGAGDHGTEQMRRCASDPAYAFSTTLTNAPGEPGINDIFEDIAEQITALRLNL